MKTENEIWQVMAGGEVYQADLATLKEWIGEGLVRPEDRVRKGNLKWIEAGRTPALRRVFSGEETAAASPVASAVGVETATQPPLSHPSPAHGFVTAEASSPSHALPSPSHAAWPSSSHAAAPSSTYAAAPLSTPSTHGAWITAGEPPPSPSSSEPTALTAPMAPAAACYNHPYQSPQFACRSCGAVFCGECVKFPEGTRIAVCALCGYFCRPYAEAAAARAQYEHRQQGFGLGDFVEALKYPFGNVASLLFGAGLYGLLMFAGFRGQVVAYAVMFGCIAIVINKVAYGKLDRDFLPDFSAFSAYDDLFMPLVLGCGVTVVTIGPTLLLIVALLFGWFGGTAENAPLRATTLSAAAQVQAENPEGPIKGEDIEALISGKGDPQKEEEIRNKIKAMSPTGQIAQQIEAAEREPGVVERVLAQLRAHPGLIGLLLLAAIGWAVFYYPMAIAVAGYTEDVWSVVNPLVGLDTIRRMGATYVKAFAMYAAVQAVGLFISFLVALVTAPFNLPLIGNLPARFIDGAVTFYINLVVACVLGLALFKSADRLGIEVD